MAIADGNSPYITPPMGFHFMGKLYDRVYFSDNGLVQFQSATINEQFLFPTPFPDGFVGNENLTMLAVFWDDADLTIGDGQLFYQEYHKLNMSDIYSQIVFNRTANDVTKFEKQNNRSAFTPTWILKITWDHVMPVSFQKTNTFQCILTTDGERSFALLRYGEMQWGPGQRVSHKALIGYTDGGKHFWNETTIPPENLFGPKGRYRPQEVKWNVEKLGQLVYDLTRPVESDSDPHIRCKSWAKKEPDPAEWAKGLSSCPCTLAQAKKDLSFGPETLPNDLASVVQKLRSQRWGGDKGHVFQSILSNRHGSGKRCVYELYGPLQAGYTERYFSKDLLPFQWCCVESPLCHLYLKKRPLDSCLGYRWTSPAMVYGSLHFITFDGSKYSFKALGEFVIVRLSSASGSNIFTLQGQTDRLQGNAQNTSKVPVVVRLAAFYQGIGKVRVEWRPAEKADGLQVFVDGVKVPVTVGNVLADFSGLVHMGKEENFVVRCKSLNRCAVVYAGGLHTDVWQVKGSNQLGAIVEVPQTFYNRTVGLLGVWSTFRSDDFLMSDNRVVPSADLTPPSEESLHQFGMSCECTTTVCSLFFKIMKLFKALQKAPESTKDLEARESPAKLAELRSQCKGSMLCVHDTLVSNSSDVGQQTLEAEEQFKDLALTYGRIPPIVTEPMVIHGLINSTVKVKIFAQDTNNDNITYSLVYHSGFLTWTPISMKPVPMLIEASDDHVSSLFTPILQVCNCLNGGTCQYDTIIENHAQGKFQVHFAECLADALR
ncbi:hypothetical protein LDENG_00046100 [Lucifuga dentata]|nr:hypothetical protein LDENG_00046100 [Lucifuga dentata]